MWRNAKFCKHKEIIQSKNLKDKEQKIHINKIIMLSLSK